jgi:molybdate-binding protein
MRAGVDVAKLNIVAPACPTGPDIARAVQTGRADCGLASRSVANAAGLDFVSLTWESFDLVVRQRDYFRKPLQTFFSFVRSPVMQRHAADAGGYDISMAGDIRYAP